MEYSRIVLASRPEGQVSENNFRLEQASLPALAEGEVLARVLYLSLDPYMRGRMDAGKSYAAAVEIDDTMEGRAVAEVVESRDPNHAPGDLVLGSFGWASHGVQPGRALMKVDPDVAPPSTALGVLGMPGFTGWLGLTAFGRPQQGETLVVGAATGAVGSMVGQIARARGLRTVGVAGGPGKCDFAVQELGFDACLDHRAAPDAGALRKQLAQACPDGVDIYFENVGDKTVEAVLPLMNVGGRIPICGMIGWYDLGGLGAQGAEGRNLMPMAWRTILVNRLTVRGFIITDHYDRFPEFLAEVAPMVRDGRVTYREDVAQGLKAAPQAFMNLLSGKNFGKQIVKVG